MSTSPAREPRGLSHARTSFVGRSEAGPLGEPPASRRGRPGLEEVIASGADLWGEAALRQPGGPTYDYFASLLRPLRYVDAPFHHYPIVLSAPGAPVKARLVSNGGAINALARQPDWRGEAGVPVSIRVGPEREDFGADLSRLEGPRYAEGFLPIVHCIDGVTLLLQSLLDKTRDLPFVLDH